MALVNIMSIYFFIMIVGTVYCAAHIRSLNNSLYARVIVLLSITICFYIIGYAMELNAINIFQLLFWNRLEYIGIPFVSALWLLSALLYTNHFNHYRTLILAAIFLVPVITLILRLTNDYHHLYFYSITFLREFGTLRLVKNPGPWMYVQSLHSMLMILLSLGLFIQDLVQSDEKSLSKLTLLIAASFIAVAGLILSLAKPLGLHLDYMALCLPATCVLMFVAVLRYEFLDAKAIAKNKIFEISQDALFLVNRQDKVIDFNASAHRILESMQADLSIERFSMLFQLDSGFLKGSPDSTAYVAKLNLDGQERYYEICTSSIDAHNTAQCWIKTVRDVTEIYKLNESLQKQAMLDELSELSNRRAFMQLGQRMAADSDAADASLCLLMMDLDLFKRVNDRYGHPMGDQVIRVFGQILKTTFPKNSLVARLGGEEFAVLLSGFSDDALSQRADMVLKATEQHEFRFQQEIFHVTVSIGISKKGPDAKDLNSLMRIADNALYQSKEHGRNCMTFL